MKRICSILLMLVATVISTGDLAELITNLKKSVITIKFTVKHKYRGTYESEVEHIERAIVITNDLVVITDGEKISGSGGYSFIYGSGVYTPISFGGGHVKPKFARAYIGKDTVVPAKYLGLNKEFDIAYFKLITKPGQKLDLKPLEVVEENKINIKVGDEVYLLGLATTARKFGFPFDVYKRVVSYQFEGGKNEFSIGWGFEIIVDKNLQVLGFGFESPITRKMSKAIRDYSTSGSDADLDSKSYQMLFTKSKLDSIIKNLPKEKKIGWLGFLPGTLETIESDLREELKLSEEEAGFRITAIPPKTPASLVGLKVDDIIIEIGGKKTVFKNPHEAKDFFEWLESIDIGKNYNVKFLRNEGGKYVKKETSIKTIEKPLYFDEIEEVEFKSLGVRVKPLTLDYKYNNRIEDEINGLVVVFTRGGEPFHFGGIKVGDIILAMGKDLKELKEIKTIDDLKGVLKDLNKERPGEIMVKIYTGAFITRQWEGASKEIQIKTVRLGATNYNQVDKDLEGE